jgi:hypothetical protein
VVVRRDREDVFRLTLADDVLVELLVDPARSDVEEAIDVPLFFHRACDRV